MILKSRGRSEKWSGKDIFYHGLLFFLDLHFQKEISIECKTNLQLRQTVSYYIKMPFFIFRLEILLEI